VHELATEERVTLEFASTGMTTNDDICARRHFGQAERRAGVRADWDNDLRLLQQMLLPGN